MPDTDSIIDHLISLTGAVHGLTAQVTGMREQIERDRAESRQEVAGLTVRVTAVEQTQAEQGRILTSITEERTARTEGKRTRRHLIVDKVLQVAVYPLGVGLLGAGLLVAHKLGLA